MTFVDTNYSLEDYFNLEWARAKGSRSWLHSIKKLAREWNSTF